MESPQRTTTDVEAIVDGLKGASLFDLYRLHAALTLEIENPARIEEVRQQLRPGMIVRYLNQQHQRIVDARIMRINRVNVDLQHLEDGEKWIYPISAIDCVGNKEKLIIGGSSGTLRRAELSIGESIGFLDKGNREQFGIIEKLNPKTASILTREGTRWRVAYSYLFRVIQQKK